MPWSDLDTDLTEWQPASRSEHLAILGILAIAALPWVAAAVVLVWRLR